ncbi:hypothetical protein ACN9TB_00705 [Lactococcus lactis]
MKLVLYQGFKKSKLIYLLGNLIAQKDLKGIEAHLREGISQYLDSDTFKNYLDFACQFQTEILLK